MMHSYKRPRRCSERWVLEGLQHHAHSLLYLRQSFEELLVHPCQFFHQLLRVHEHDLDVHSIRPSLEPHTTHHELLDAQLIAVILVQHLEERSGVSNVQAHLLEEDSHTAVLHGLLKVQKRDAARAVRVHPVKDSLEPQKKVTVFHQFLLQLHVVVLRRHVQGLLHEDAGDDVHHRKHGEENEDEKDEKVPRGDVQEDASHRPPIHAAGNRHEEREDRHGQRTEVGPDVRRDVVIFSIEHHVLNDAMDDDDAKNEHHNKEDEHRPDKRNQRLDDGQHHEAQTSHYWHQLHNVEHPKRTYDSGNADHSQVAEVHTQTDKPNLSHRGHRQHGVEQVPARILANNELAFQSKEPQEDFEHKQDREHDLRHKHPRRSPKDEMPRPNRGPGVGN
mmetsp:Transcript_50756/g.135361  ORF Transcript_50756/g.135361 Transcript_50756/m.135361 type:complete len:389 (-) Transcript_50756:1012-2178(-)